MIVLTVTDVSQCLGMHQMIRIVIGSQDGLLKNLLRIKNETI